MGIRRTEPKTLPPQNHLHPYWEALATYNSERARGIVHTPEWVDRMKRRQKQWDRLNTLGVTPDHGLPPGLW